MNILKIKIINLSQNLNLDASVFPGDPEVKFQKFANVENDGFNLSQSFFGNHTGTHIQTNLVVESRGKKLSNYDINDFHADGLLIDVSNKSNDALIDINVIKSLPQDLSKKAVLFYTKYNNHIKDKEYFSYTPTLSIKLIDELLKRNCKIICIDSHSICSGPFEQYKKFIGKKTLLVEGLVNLERLIGKKFEFFAIPPITDTEAFPVTAFAMLK